MESLAILSGETSPCELGGRAGSAVAPLLSLAGDKHAPTVPRPGEGHKLLGWDHTSPVVQTLGHVLT